MHPQGLPPLPGVPSNCRILHVTNLLDHVELAEPPEAGLVVGLRGELVLVLLEHVSDVSNPAVHQSQRGAFVRGAYAAAHAGLFSGTENKPIVFSFDAIRVDFALRPMLNRLTTRCRRFRGHLTSRTRT